ncbi:MAG: ABC transporter substrate-binding protein [Clostridiales bacterium]|nr:ABC transporter substrate-binding protein [Clostridiales bacterium]
MKKLFALLLVLCMLCGMTSAFAQETQVDTSEFVTLTMYVVSEEPPRYKEMLEEFNAMAKEELNCELVVNFIGWGEYQTKYPLLFSSGEEFDLVYVATWLDYANLAQRGAFLPLEELLPAYCAESMKNQPEQALLQASVEGHVYAYTSNRKTYSAYGAIVRGEYMDKYGIEEITDMESYAKFLQAIVDNEPSFTNPAGGMNDVLYDEMYLFAAGLYPLSGSTGGVYYLDPEDPEHKVIAAHEWEGFSAMCDQLQVYSEAGYWPKSILSVTDAGDVLLNQGISASRLHNFDSWVGAHNTNPDWDMRWYNLLPEINHLSYMQDAISVPSTSKYPERALMLLDKIRSDERYYMLLTYGVEGVDYTLDENDFITNLDTDLFPSEPGTWGFRVEEFYKMSAGAPENYYEERDKLEAAVVPNIFRSFNMDTSSVKNEYAAMQNVYSQYYNTLAAGVTTDVASDIEKLNKQAEIAGNEIIKEVLQAQVDAFFAEYGE